MTHQELLNSWVDAETTCVYELSGTISESIFSVCQQAIEYAEQNGLDIPPEVRDTVLNRFSWDNEDGKWNLLLGSMIDRLLDALQKRQGPPRH